MSPETVRLLFVSGLSILVGGFIGAYAAKSIYDTPTTQNRGQNREKPSCPPCAECPTCPPPTDCGERSLVPTSTRSETRALLVPDGEETEHDRKPGLPASAIRRASEKVRESIAPCLEESQKENGTGTMLLELTVTATGTEAFISDVSIAKKSAGTLSGDEVDRCIVESARRARFDWDEGDGEAHFRLPVKLGR